MASKHGRFYSLGYSIEPAPQRLRFISTPAQSLCTQLRFTMSCPKNVGNCVGNPRCRVSVSAIVPLMIVAVCFIAVHGHTDGWDHDGSHSHGAMYHSGECGSGQPHLVAMSAAAPRIPQDYSPRATVRGDAGTHSGSRRAQSTFTPISEADALGETAPLRIYVRNGRNCAKRNLSLRCHRRLCGVLARAGGLEHGYLRK